MAVEVRAALGLDVVALMVAATPWQKVDTREISPAEDRLAVARAALSGLRGIEVSDLEVRRGGSTYTADTLVQLRDGEPDLELFLVVGADVAGQLATWRRLDEVRQGATLVTVGRPGATVPLRQLRSDGWRVEHVDVPALDVSSSEIRARRRSGRPIDVLVPPGAVREIEERGLYAPSG